MLENSNKNQPLVTIYMPTHSRVKLLKRAVESVLNQEYSNIELIVVDDKSSDSTIDYLKEVSKQDPRVRYFTNEVNSGACVSRNKAIFAAKGDFITGLDDDDYLLPSHISSFINTWNNKKDDCIALYPNSYTNRTEGLVAGPKRPQSCNHKNLLCYNWIGNQLFTKTQYLQEVEGFDKNLSSWQDLECWYRLLDYYQLNAYSTENYSYIVDIDHPHERITIKNASLILETYKYLANKHKLNKKESSALKLHLISYTNTAPKISSVINGLRYIPDPTRAIRIFRLALRPIRYKISNYKL